MALLDGRHKVRRRHAAKIGFLSTEAGTARLRIWQAAATSSSSGTSRAVRGVNVLTWQTRRGTPPGAYRVSAESDLGGW